MLKNTELEGLLLMAENSNGEALLELSDRFQKGIGGAERSEERAYSYAKSAFAAGNMEALARLADYYAKGRGGVEQNEEHARELLAEGEKLNSVRCLQRLAFNYMNGECGYEKDETKAIEYCTKIIAHPSDDANVKGYAYTCVGSVYEEGRIGAEKNLKKALTFYQKAAKVGYAFAYVLLGNQKRRLYLQEKAAVTDMTNDVVTPDEREDIKNRTVKMRSMLADVEALYRQAETLAAKDADVPVSECAKAYLDEVAEDRRNLLVLEKKLSILDATNYDGETQIPDGPYKISFDDRPTEELTRSLSDLPVRMPTVAKPESNPGYVEEDGYGSAEGKSIAWGRVLAFAAVCAAVSIFVAWLLSQVF